MICISFVCQSQWGAITVIVINSPILGQCAKNSLERLAGTVIGGWLGYAFRMAVLLQSKAWLPVISVLYALLAATLGNLLEVQGAANLSIITLLSGALLTPRPSCMAPKYNKESTHHLSSLSPTHVNGPHVHVSIVYVVTLMWGMRSALGQPGHRHCDDADGGASGVHFGGNLPCDIPVHHHLAPGGLGGGMSAVSSRLSLTGGSPASFFQHQCDTSLKPYLSALPGLPHCVWHAYFGVANEERL